MLVRIQRIFKGADYTIGRLYIDGVYFCDTLEDPVREEKIPGKTAIPKGKYSVVKNYSPRFKKTLPLIENVPGFSGVRIHAGNGPEDTEGCILLGLNKEKGRVLDSRDAVAFFMARTPKTFEIRICE